MNGTIVYAEATHSFDIIPSDLIAIIAGGMVKEQTSLQNVTMDATRSRDPDFPDNPLR